MILVDSSVWIDYFRDQATPGVALLERLIGTERLATGDLMLAEVLQGTDSDRAFEQALMALRTTRLVPVVGIDTAIKAARNYRFLCSRGITIRKTIDTLIATRCISDGYQLLYSDRDFDPFVEHLGLRIAEY